MANDKQPLKVGVVIGDFQIHYINNAYQEYINYAETRNRILVILIKDRGLSLDNPLSFESRVAMIREEYPNAITYKVSHSNDTKIMSSEIDRAVMFLQEHDITLYLSPEDHDYCGSFTNKKLSLDVSTYRALTMLNSLPVIPDTQEARYGCLWLGENAAPTNNRIYNILTAPVTHNILLIRRKGGSMMELPSGIMLPSDNSFEEASKRIISNMGTNLSYNHQYVCSSKTDVVISSVYIGGALHNGDDIEFTSWVKITEETSKMIDSLSRKYIECFKSK